MKFIQEMLPMFCTGSIPTHTCMHVHTHRYAQSLFQLISDHKTICNCQFYLEIYHFGVIQPFSCHLLNCVNLTRQLRFAQYRLGNIWYWSTDNLKISDFGLATMFRHQGQERMLETCCGTLPYVCPEVIRKLPDKAEPVDLWSCGIILVALLAGGSFIFYNFLLKVFIICITCPFSVCPERMLYVYSW